MSDKIEYMQKLVDALKTGRYDVAPAELREGCVYEIVDIDPICKQIVEQARKDFAPKLERHTEHCGVCKLPIYMISEGPADSPIYCTRHSKEFWEQHVKLPFCDHCKNSGNDPHVHFLGDIKLCYCGSFKACTDPGCHLVEK